MSNERLIVQNKNEIFDHLKKLSNAAKQPLIDTNNSEETKVHIREDKKVPLAKFLPDPLIQGGWLAHPITIRAMKKDIFIVGDSFEDLEFLYKCSCGKTLDLQFWHFCPYCEKSFEAS